MIRIAIVEDEKESLDHLISLLDRFQKEEKQEFELVSYADGMDFASDYQPVYDIVFMDIEMPFLNGMDTAKKMRKLDGNVSLIFITRMSKYALQGYEVDAVGYLVKPVEYFSFSRLLRKVIEKNKFFQGTDFYIKTVEGVVKVKQEHLMYVEIIDHFLIYHTTNGNYKAYGQISKAENSLPKEHFFRCNKSYLVNFAFVKKVVKSSIFIGDEEILISRSKHKQFIFAFHEYVERCFHG